MIYLITGTPGAGKTLYAVGTFIKKMMADVTRADGSVVKRRLLVDGIPNLAIDHQPLAAGKVGSDGILGPSEGCGVWNWHEWAQPGDLIVIDEVQRWWRPRGMGTKPPVEIQQLETHRHKGVDFVIITQSASLLDQNVRRLVERHTHVRRVLGGARSILYDWDGCQVNTSSTKLAVTSYWSYPKDAFKLYTSSQLHVKPRARIPFWVFIPLLAIAGFLFMGPKAYTTLMSAMTGKGVSGYRHTEPVEESPAARLPGAGGDSPDGSIDVRPRPFPLDRLPPLPPVPEAPPVPARAAVVGCMSSALRCTCYDEAGFIVPLDEPVCRSGLFTAGGVVSIGANL